MVSNRSIILPNIEVGLNIVPNVVVRLNGAYACVSLHYNEIPKSSQLPYAVLFYSWYIC